MINRIFAISMAAMLGQTALSVESTATGFSGHGGHHGFGHRSYDGVVTGYVLGDVSDSAPTLSPQSHDVASPLPAANCAVPMCAVTCHHSRETVTVPAEEDGTREITIIRC